jgi:hypothetical protein
VNPEGGAGTPPGAAFSEAGLDVDVERARLDVGDGFGATLTGGDEIADGGSAGVVAAVLVAGSSSRPWKNPNVATVSRISATAAALPAIIMPAPRLLLRCRQCSSFGSVAGSAMTLLQRSRLAERDDEFRVTATIIGPFYRRLWAGLSSP